MGPGDLVDLDIGASEAQQRDHPAVPLEPPLDQLVLSGVGDPGHVFDCGSRVPPPLHAVQ